MKLSYSALSWTYALKVNGRTPSISWKAFVVRSGTTRRLGSSGSWMSE